MQEITTEVLCKNIVTSGYCFPQLAGQQNIGGLTIVERGDKFEWV
jgi:hypothetical protein